jgi:hypothetical protein
MIQSEPNCPYKGEIQPVIRFFLFVCFARIIASSVSTVILA